MKPSGKFPLGVMGWLLLLLFASGCNYQRMNEQESVRTYETTMPEMPAETIPVKGGVQVLRTVDPQSLKNPLPNSAASIQRGGLAYAYFCIHCHGPKADGQGTVGQSFSPLPADLNSPLVQNQPDGLLFYKISLGYLRHPPLASTVSSEDRWAVILYLRSLGRKAEG